MSAKDRQTRPQLKASIEDESFWHLSDRDVLVAIKLEYSQELERLQTATFIRNPNAVRPEGPSISEQLYGQDYAEINRTLGQSTSTIDRLTRDSFTWLRSIFSKELRSADDTYALITAMVINDLGKVPSLADEYASKKHKDISKVNHDMILYHAINAGLITPLGRLPGLYRRRLLMGIRLGSEFNYGQLAQAENAPASLAGLLMLRGHDDAFEMRYAEQILDLAGAAGHEDWTCAKKMTEPIFQSYKNVYDVGHAIISKGMSLREGFDIILIRKLQLLHKAGYKRQFVISNLKDRAVMRLFCLGNTTNADSAEVFFKAFTEEVPEQSRQELVTGLNVDGSASQPAVQPTYIPAMFTKALGNTRTGSQEEKIKAVASVLKYLGRCLIIHPEQRSQLPKDVTVVERDVRNLTPVLESGGFRDNPDILDQEAIPDDQVANRACPS